MQQQPTIAIIIDDVHTDLVLCVVLWNEKGESDWRSGVEHGRKWKGTKEQASASKKGIHNTCMQSRAEQSKRHTHMITQENWSEAV